MFKKTKNALLLKEVDAKNKFIELLQHENKSLKKQLDFAISSLEAIHTITKNKGE